MNIRIDLYVHGLSTHEDEAKLDLILRNQVKTLASMKDLNDKIDAQAQSITDLTTAIDALIASNAANFQALKDALAANDPAAVDAAIAKIDAAQAALVAAKDKVVAADEADNLP